MALTKEQIQQIAAQTRSSFETGSFAPTGVQCLFDDVHDAIDTAIRAQHQLMDMSLEERGKLIEANGEADVLVADELAAFREAAIRLLDTVPDLSLDALDAEHDRLAARLERFGTCRDALDIWSALGIGQPARLPLLDTDEFLTATADRRA